jgi:hypothetical protein
MNIPDQPMAMSYQIQTLVSRSRLLSAEFDLSRRLVGTRLACAIVLTSSRAKSRDPDMLL